MVHTPISVLVFLSLTATVLADEYTIVKGFFKQDDEDIDASDIDYQDNLGLNDDLDWSTFAEKIHDLKDDADDDESYKVIYFGRHGEGYHNIAADKYEDAFWCYYALREGDDEITWGPDPKLTDKGVSQAKKNHDLIENLIDDDLPLPEVFYSSPLTRCADTLTYTWKGNGLDGMTPIFKENLREQLNPGTPNMRNDRKYLEEHYPSFEFEDGFADIDTLLQKCINTGTSETSEGMQKRAKAFLDEIFDNSNATFVSVTSHSGLGKNLLRVVGHRKYHLHTAEILPMVIKRKSSESDSIDGPFTRTANTDCSTGTYPALPASRTARVTEVPSN
ncbi:unnamed protein product [Ambrosiozyma monospora]|uniref:Unnamed protein product n=1 Tax=Ambrosiozyma monospora TaxID=43982 RepID=A0ACB5SW10_AMBMO|nr:unnamed protein product [Ambrosiozyma monospora]